MASAAEPFSWTGFFAGVDVGHVNSAYGVSDATGPQYQNEIDSFNGDFDMTSIAYGGHIGYHHQLDNNLVVGVQGLVIAPNLSGGFAGDNIAEVAVSVDWFAGVYGTIGYAFDRAMFYGGAGVAMGGVSVDVSGINYSVDLAAQEQHLGWMGTLGMAYALTDNVFVSFDYTRVDFGTTSYDLTGEIEGSMMDVTAQGGGTGDVLRAGLSFRF
jgi:outer membrane immunogenic protein